MISFSKIQSSFNNNDRLRLSTSRYNKKTFSSRCTHLTHDLSLPFFFSFFASVNLSSVAMIAIRTTFSLSFIFFFFLSRRCPRRVVCSPCQRGELFLVVVLMEFCKLQHSVSPSWARPLCYDCLSLSSMARCSVSKSKVLFFFFFLLTPPHQNSLESFLFVGFFFFFLTMLVSPSVVPFLENAFLFLCSLPNSILFYLSIWFTWTRLWTLEALTSQLVHSHANYYPQWCTWLMFLSFSSCMEKDIAMKRNARRERVATYTFEAPLRKKHVWFESGRCSSM